MKPSFPSSLLKECIKVSKNYSKFEVWKKKKTFTCRKDEFPIEHTVWSIQHNTDERDYP